MAPNDPNITPTNDIPEADASAAPADDAPVLDMDAINAAVAATENEGNKIQNTFDVNDISLDNTPTSDAELEKQMADNPDMNLAGGASDEPAEPAEPAAPADYTNNSDPIDSPAATGPKPAEDKKPAETAGFVDGDIANESDSADGEHSDEPPVVAANVVTAPGAKKSNKSLFMILGGVGALAVIVVLIIVIMSL